jgi:predicted RNA-binding protein with PIN domain
MKGRQDFHATWIGIRRGGREFTVSERARYLIVDGHSVIFAWPELRKLHARRSSLAREALIKQLRDYQDWTGVRLVVVFDGKGKKVEASSDPHDVQIFYSRSGQSADAIIERLASKYAKDFELVVATSDSLEAETVMASGAEWISPEALRTLLSRKSL